MIDLGTQPVSSTSLSLKSIQTIFPSSLTNCSMISFVFLFRALEETSFGDPGALPLGNIGCMTSFACGWRSRIMPTIFLIASATSTGLVLSGQLLLVPIISTMHLALNPSSSPCSMRQMRLCVASPR